MAGHDIMKGVRADIPDLVTHYYIAGRAPFLNLSDLAEERLDAVILDLERERARGASARVFGRRYMELRRRTEEKLRSLFIEVGGTPNARHRTTSCSDPRSGTGAWRARCERSSSRWETFLRRCPASPNRTASPRWDWGVTTGSHENGGPTTSGCIDLRNSRTWMSLFARSCDVGPSGTRCPS
jgi:hypothetical protein